MKKFGYVTLSSYLTIALSFLISLYVPRMMTIDDYGQYKIFTFYILYTSIFAMGIIEYALIKYSKLQYDEMENQNYLGLILVTTFVNLRIIVVLLVLNEVFFESNMYALILLFSVPRNLINIFANTSRANRRFYVSSTLTLMIQSLIFIVVVFMDYYNVGSYLFLINARFIINFIVIMLFIVTYWKIMKSKFDFKNAISDWKAGVKTGMPLVAGYFIGQLAFGLDRIFIERTEFIEYYAYYSFAYSLIAIYSASLSSLATFYYPYLSKFNDEVSAKFYEVITRFFNLTNAIFLYSILILPIIVNILYPEYKESVISFAILAGASVYQVQYTLKQSQYFFKYEKGVLNTIFNIFLLVLNLLLNYTVYLKNLPYYYYGYATVLSFMIWYIIVEIYFVKFMKHNLIYDNIITSLLALNVVVSFAFFESKSIFFGVNTIIIISQYKFILRVIRAIKKKDLNEVLI